MVAEVAAEGEAAAVVAVEVVSPVCSESRDCGTFGADSSSSTTS